MALWGNRARAAALVCLLNTCLVLSYCKRPGASRPREFALSVSQSTQNIEVHDFLELTATVPAASARNPFTDAVLTGRFEVDDGSQHWQVDGFCDSDDGSIYRIRFMPRVAGKYRYLLEYRQGGVVKIASGSFHARSGHRHGPIRIDAKYPWHFVWEGTGEHYFLNGTTAYWLMGWSDEKVIEDSIERLHRLKVNRIRVTVAGRTNIFYGEPVMVDKAWTVFLTPWPAEMPQDVYHPGFDYTRFDVSHWQRLDRMLRFARDRNMIVSLVLDMNDSRTHPAAASGDERRFFRYAVARFAAFSNITWDLGDDLDQYRTTAWTHDTGEMIYKWDPYHHLATSHPIDNRHQDLTADWFGFTSFQEWSRNQHTFMLLQRRRQKALGRVIPQTNEEYGYEDHYPLWAQGPGSESADTLRRTAWDIVMAGGYQTTGESARRGTNIWPDTGGGWLNGRGDDTMTMLQGYGHMVDFFTSFDWWKTEPHDELVSKNAYCLAQPGEIYVAYLPHGGRVSLRLKAGRYSAAWFNPSSGEKVTFPVANGSVWTSPDAPDQNDWALLLTRIKP